MSFMQGVDITRAIGRVGLKVKPVLGPEIAQNRRDFHTNTNTLLHQRLDKTMALGNRASSRKCVMYVSVA